jgi:uncharacterized protein (DUF302 family)
MRPEERTSVMASFGIRKPIRATFDEALNRIPEVLKAEGFGILTEIDVRSTLKQKLDVDFRRYKILGACNPPFAHQALTAEIEVGLVLPCNVIVYEGDNNETVVVAVDPTRTVATTGNPKLDELAATVKEKLTRALDKLE